MPMTTRKIALAAHVGRAGVRCAITVPFEPTMVREWTAAKQSWPVTRSTAVTKSLFTAGEGDPGLYGLVDRGCNLNVVLTDRTGRERRNHAVSAPLGADAAAQIVVLVAAVGGPKLR
jgi:hypothetical protein